MHTLPPIKQEDQEIMNNFVEIVNFVKDSLIANPIYKDKLKPKQTFLVTMFAAVNSYTEAIFELCKDSRPEAAIVILRSLIEALINSHYVLGHPNENLLWLFAIEDSYYRRSLIEEMEKFYKRYPKLRNKLHTRKKFKEIKEIIDEELKAYKGTLRLSFNNKDEFDKDWGSLLSRAKLVDKRLKKKQKDKAGGLEHTYLIVYKYFSEYTHLQMRGIQHFWIKDDKGESLILDKHPGQITHVLVTTYTIYLYFANRLKQYKIINCSLAKFDSYFNKEITKKLANL